MYCETRSKSIVEDLSRLGDGILYTQTIFIQDMWPQWTGNQSSYLPSNIRNGEMVTHVFDNIDWKMRMYNELKRTIQIRYLCRNVVQQKIWQKLI